MALQIVLSPSQIVDLKEFLATPRLAFEGIDEKWSEAMSSEALIEGIAISDKAVARKIIRLLIGLRLLMLQSDSDESEVIGAIDDSLCSEIGEDLGLVSLGAHSKLLEDLLASAHLRRVALAINLSYEYSNLLQGSRIITDIRPIYDENATRIEAAVVSYTLRIKYDRAGVDNSISLAMDDEDVKSLLEQCKRALEKSRIAQEHLVASGAILSKIAGKSSASRTFESL